MKKKIKIKKYDLGGPNPPMSFNDAMDKFAKGKMTAQQANAATGYKPKPLTMTNAQVYDKLKSIMNPNQKLKKGGTVGKSKKK